MNMAELQGQLKHGERLLVSGDKQKVFIFQDGVVKRTYLISDDGQLWPESTDIRSKPPAGKCRVTNLYVDSSTGKLVVEYDDTIQPP